jgi:hypothetical protein
MNTPYAYQYRSLAAALSKLSFDARLLEVVGVICEELTRQNPRFDIGLFMEWVLEDK